MAWTWDEIEGDWLAGSKIAEDRDVIVDAFNEVDQAFGRHWIEGSRIGEGLAGPVRGSLVTLNIVVLGKHLALLSSADRCRHLVRKLGERRPGAYAELDAVSLLKSRDARIRLECEPRVIAGGRTRKPDFRVARGGEEWTYVEVTQPQRSAAEMSLHEAMSELVSVLETVDGEYTAEVFFLEQPGPDSVRALRPELEEICRRPGVAEFAIGEDLAIVYLNQAQPGIIEPNDHGHESRPRLGRAQSYVEGGFPRRHLVVRVPYTDTRVAHFLATEASQLPESDPGLIMIQASLAAGRAPEWVSTIEDEFALQIYKNVSALCFFHTGFYPSDHGETWKIVGRVIENPAATHRLPDWLKDAVGGD